MSVSSFDCLFCLKKTSSLKNKLTTEVLKDFDLFRFLCKHLLLNNPEINNFNLDSINSEGMLPVCTKCANLYKQLAELHSEFKELETQIKIVVQEFRQFVISSESVLKDEQNELKNTSDFHRIFRQHVLRPGGKNNEEFSPVHELNIKEEIIEADESEIETTNILTLMDMSEECKTEEDFDTPDQDDFYNDDDPMDQEEGFESESEIPRINVVKTQKVEIETCIIEPRRSLRNRAPSQPSIKKEVTTIPKKKSFKPIKKKGGLKKPKPKPVKVIRKKYFCSVPTCGIQVKDRKVLRRHHHKHESDTPEKEKTLSCPLCQKLFIVPHLLRRHVYLHRLQEDKDTETFICQQCEVSCKTQELLDKHITTTHQRDVVKFICTICGRQFKSECGFDRHVQAHSGIKREQRNRCKLCPEEFAQYIQLKKHELEKHPEFAQIFSCTFCGKKWPTNSNLQLHLKTHTKEKTHECKICHEKFRTKHAVDSHHVRDHGKGYHSCTICEDKKFISKRGLAKHNEIHHNEGKVRYYQCTMCDKKFTIKRSLERHILTHGEARNFTCELCGKSFKSPDTLYNHRFLHSDKDNLRYKCGICDQSFSWSQSRKNHMKTHHGIDAPPSTKPNSSTSVRSSSDSTSNSATNSIAIGQVGTNLPAEFPTMYSNSYPFPGINY